MSRVSTVIFACVHNAGRSQMAAAWFQDLADPAKARAISAGTEPGTRVHPEVLEAMREVGIDLADRKPQKLTDELAAGAEMLITMGCGEQCPVVPGLRRALYEVRDSDAGVYALTTTAESYLARFGFARVPRGLVPQSLFESRELQDACPASAAVMQWQQK